MRLHQASGGQALIEGKDILLLTEKELPNIKEDPNHLQNPYASLNPRFTIGQILLEPMQIHGIGKDDAERKQIALGLLERVNLPEQAYYRYPHMRARAVNANVLRLRAA